MENNKGYLQKIPLIFLIAVASVIIQVFFWKYDNTGEDKNYVLVFARAIFYDVVFFVSLAIALNKWKKAMISLAISSAVVCFEIYLYHIKDAGNTGAARNYLIVELLSLLPYIFFLFEKEHHSRKQLLS